MKEINDVNEIDREIDRLKRLKDVAEKMDGVVNGTHPEHSRMKSVQEEGNDLYTIRGAIVKGKNETRTYGEHNEGMVQSIAFAYRVKGKTDVYDAMLVADAWNDVLRYNAFEEGEEYDLDLRLNGRQGRDGRWFGGVSIQKARRVWKDGELGKK